MKAMKEMMIVVNNEDLRSKGVLMMLISLVLGALL